MGVTATFDTLHYAKKLQEAGVPTAQAEAQAEALAEIIESELATKRDLKELELRLVTRLGAIVVFAIGAEAALVKMLSP